MAVKIRLARHGSNKNPIYRVVVADSRVPRDGRTLEEIGRYNPQMEPSLVEIDADRAREWISRGAQPTETVRKPHHTSLRMRSRICGLNSSSSSFACSISRVTIT